MLSPPLDGPGRISRRQTTYWDLQPAGAGGLRVHFTGKEETRFESAQYDRAELVDSHPLLIAYQEPWASLYIADASRCGARLGEDIEALVVKASGGWRHAAEYFGAPTDLVVRLGFGLLLSAPESIVRMAAAVVRDHGFNQAGHLVATARPWWSAITS